MLADIISSDEMEEIDSLVRDQRAETIVISGKDNENDETEMDDEEMRKDGTIISQERPRFVRTSSAETVSSNECEEREIYHPSFEVDQWEEEEEEPVRSQSPLKKRPRNLTRKPTKKASRSTTQPTRSKITKQPITPPKRIARKAWDDHEHSVIVSELRELRSTERADGRVGKLGLRDVKLWTYISNRLGASGIYRTPSACKDYFSRYGRLRSGFDERAIPVPHQLATSTQ